MINRLLFLFIISINIALAGNSDRKVVWDEYRVELKAMLVRGHKPLTDYSKSRKYIMQKVHIEQDEQGYFIHDVYCNINYRQRVGPGSMPPSSLINIEHTMPKKHFNDSLSYYEQLSDLHNLYPTYSKANSARGHRDFTNLSGNSTAKSLEGCSASKFGYNFDIGMKGFEVPMEQKGNAARSLFYFSIRWDITIPKHEEALMRIWNILDPVDEAELERNNKIEKLQGNRNVFIDDGEYADFISNF